MKPRFAVYLFKSVTEHMNILALLKYPKTMGLVNSLKNMYILNKKTILSGAECQF